MKQANYCSLKWEGSTDVEDESGLATFTADRTEVTVRLSKFILAQALVNMINGVGIAAFDNGVEAVKYRVSKI